MTRPPTEAASKKRSPGNSRGTQIRKHAFLILLIRTREACWPSWGTRGGAMANHFDCSTSAAGIGSEKMGWSPTKTRTLAQQKNGAMFFRCQAVALKSSR
jgi:hypothetical protein